MSTNQRSKPFERLLVTADPLEAESCIQRLEKDGIPLLHLPLDRFEYGVDELQQEMLIPMMDRFRYVLHGGLRNATHFLTWVEKNLQREAMNSWVHLTHLPDVASLLEQAGIAAIRPEGARKPIDLIEFLLRISGSGAVLYPVGSGETEELPGLLEEIGMEYEEMVVSSSSPLDPSELQKMRSRVKETPPDAVLFHSRGSVLRTFTAFPELRDRDLVKIVASQGAGWKLTQEGETPDHQAGGSWSSVADLVISLAKGETG